MTRWLRIAQILKYLAERQGQGTSVSLAGPPAQVLVQGYDRVFLEEANRAAARAVAAREASDSRVEAGSTAAAILCAVAAIEAAMSEHLAKLELVEGLDAAQIRSIRGDPDALGQWKALLRLCAPAYVLGESKQFLALSCLLKLRDHVAHRHARTAPIGGFPENLSDCVRQKVVPAHPARNADWTSVVFVADVGTWAATTAQDWLGLAEQLLPEPKLR